MADPAANAAIASIAGLVQAVAPQIEQAASIDELQAAALRVDALVVQLDRDGARIERIAALVGELNSRLFARTWTLVAPAGLQREGCLMVMGSEGRGEQIVKTDQDNALLLPDGHPCDGLEAAAGEFSAALRRFGYPACPGGIMVTNPMWCQALAGFKDTLRRWLRGPDPQGVMNLAIFMDARAVSGNEDLLAQARRFLYDCLVDDDAFFARFARAAIQFQEGGGWWRRLVGREPATAVLDLKKLGTFPIVHGVRALALQGRIDELNTAERLQALARRGVLQQALAQDLTDALRALMGMKMRLNLRQRELGLPPDNLVRLSDLGTLERGLLRDCLAVIRPFRRHLQRHFHLDAL